MTPRYNPFMQIHKGLQAMLYHTALAIQHNDFANQRSTSLVVDQVQKVLWLFEGHAHTEDSMVFPLIAEHAPEVVADFEAQHETDHQLGATLEAILEKVAACNSSAECMATGLELKRAFEKFIAFNLEHMIKEETIVAPIIWQHYSDAELHELTGRIVRALPEDKNRHYTDWMLIGNSDAEVIQWLHQVRDTAPSFVYDGLCERARNVLNADRWQYIETAMQTFAISNN